MKDVIKVGATYFTLIVAGITGAYTGAKIVVKLEEHFEKKSNKKEES